MKIFFTFILFFKGFMSLADTGSATGQLVVSDKDSEVEFTAIGKPGFLRINGESKHLSGTANIEKGTADFTFSLGTLVTGMDMRDRHMKDNYLEVKKFPDASLKITKFDVGAKKSVDQDFEGELSLHGITKPVTGHAKFECGTEQNCEIEAKLTLKLSDYGIAIPEYAGITVAEKVDIRVETKMVRRTDSK